MKYLGNKTRLIDFIEESLRRHNIIYNNVNALDLCAGTGAVSLFFKRNHCNVTSVDIMNYSVGELYRTLYFNEEPLFPELENEVGGQALDQVIEFLNNLEPIQDYYFNEYSDGGNAHRKYFSFNNGMKIDALMHCLERWKQILPNEKYIFLRGIVVNSIDRISNIAGTYGAYLKIWRSMALKDLVIVKPEFINGGHVNIVKDDIVHFLSNNNHFYDIVYLDPPYNNRQYAPNFHVLENLSNNDRPELTGVTGLINYNNQKSNFCYSKKAVQELDAVLENVHSNTFIFSYSTEGIMKIDDIERTFLKYYENVSIEENRYRRFKTNSNTEANTGLCELLFIATNRRN